MSVGIRHTRNLRCAGYLSILTTGRVPDMRRTHSCSINRSITLDYALMIAYFQGSLLMFTSLVIPQASLRSYSIPCSGMFHTLQVSFPLQLLVFELFFSLQLVLQFSALTYGARFFVLWTTDTVFLNLEPGTHPLVRWAGHKPSRHAPLIYRLNIRHMSILRWRTPTKSGLRYKSVVSKKNDSRCTSY